MKIGTVRWFNHRKGYGFIHADDGDFNIFVDMSAVERAGISNIKEGQRVNFEIQRNARTGDMSAVSLKALGSATTTHLDCRFPTLIAAARAATCSLTQVQR